MTVDAWVKAKEPRKFFEGFGTGFYHVFLGYVNPGGLAWALGNVDADVTPNFNQVTPKGRQHEKVPYEPGTVSR